MSLLEFRNVTKKYNSESIALNNVSFNIEQGEFVSIIGLSGAGKSTLLRCVNRMIDATEGNIIFDSTNVVKANKKELKDIRIKTGMIFQHYNLVNRLSVFENVLHGKLGQKSTLQGIFGIYSEEDKKEAFEILELLGLADQAYKRCDELSGGQKQRVGIARAIMQKPKLLLCDEPIASLDPSSSKIIMEKLHKINKEMNITCLVNLHQVDVATKYSSRILGMNKGELLFDGKTSNLTNEMILDIYNSKQGDLIIEYPTVVEKRKLGAIV